MKNSPNINLSANLNKIILIRNARDASQPDPCVFAKIALENGAQGITVHPRSDERHTKQDDVRKLASYIHLQKPNSELNIEGNPFSKMRSNNKAFLDLVIETEPDQCTLVPDHEHQLTSDHGWDFSSHLKELAEAIAVLKKKKIRVSLFVDPDCKKLALAKEIGADRIEIYTERFARAFKGKNEQDEFLLCQSLAEEAEQLGLEVNAGHDLNLENLHLLKKIKQIKEVSIGQALIVDALQMGFASAVSAYHKALNP